MYKRKLTGSVNDSNNLNNNYQSHHSLSRKRRADLLKKVNKAYKKMQAEQTKKSMIEHYLAIQELESN